MLAAFQAWKLAELAMHYASPCPDEIMDHLVQQTYVTFDALQATPAENADDVLLKLYPIMLREFEPKKGEPPLRLSGSSSYEYDEAFRDRLNADLCGVSAQIAAAAAEVNPHGRRAA
ncbi:hypothetical protein [Sphingomonas phyllosphaerae]|uniref:hypothetical protein n=1 Tax=Sphingomonas phyllosphaerae TaxID=257003 RepID=UPI002FF61336